MWGSTNGGQGSGRPRRRAAAGAAKMITLVTVLAVVGIGYLRSAAHEPPAPAAPAAPAVPALHAAPGRFTARATIAVARLQRRYGSSYTRTHFWQAANALAATIGYMHATGSRAFLGDLRATYQVHHRGDSFRDRFYDDEGWWVLTWIRAYDLTG